MLVKLLERVIYGNHLTLPSSPFVSPNLSLPKMAKRFFHTLSTTLQQHSSRHIRRHHPLKNKTHFHHKYSHPSFSPTPNLLSSFKKSEFVAWYLNKLETNPIITKAVTSSLICAAADLSSQMIRKPPVYGLLILGPSQHLWFNFLSNILPTRGLVSTLMKTYLNYVFFSYDDNRFQGQCVDDHECYKIFSCPREIAFKCVNGWCKCTL